MEPGELRHVVDVTGLVAQGLFQTQIPRMAAALAYRTIFAIVPVLIVAFAAMGSFATDEQMAFAVRSLVEFGGLDRVVAVPSSVEPEGAMATSVARPSVRQQEELSYWISDIVQRVRSGSMRTLGVFGLLVLAYAAISMLVELELSFNQVYRAVTVRSWGERVTRYWTLVTLGAMFLVATFFVGERFKSMVSHWVESEVLGPLGTVLLTSLGFLTTVVISTMLWLVVYLLVPATHVRVRPAVVGAIVAAILWETGKWGFTRYATYSTSYAQLYGSIALVPLFIFWVYITWLIVLFGLNISYALQHFRTWRETQEKGKETTAFVDPAAVLLVMQCIAESFKKGESADAESLSERVRLPEPPVQAMLNALADADLLHRLDERSAAEPRYVLARPPELIPVQVVLDVGRQLAGPLSDSSNGEVLHRLRDHGLDAMAGKSIAELSVA